MSRQFKIFLLVVLSVFSTLNLSANDIFFSIEQGAPAGNYLEGNSCNSVEELADAGGDVLTKLLKNSDYKKFYDDLANGITTRKFPNELTIQEEAIYKFYTNETYYKFNDALVGKSSADDVIELEKLLNSTLDKVASAPGTYFRGIGKGELDKILAIGEKGTIKYDNFLSSSVLEEKAAKFVKTNKTKTGIGAWVEIQSKNGKSIAKYSDAGFEAEMLHKSKSSFEIISIKSNQKILVDPYEVSQGVIIEYETVINDVYKIILKEL